MLETIFSYFYKIFPVFLQNFGISLYGFYWKKRRNSGAFYSQIQKFSQREQSSSEDWITYQTKELRELLIHSFTNVPYYKKKYTNAGFKLEDFENFYLKDLKKLPFLEKKDLREFGDNDLLSNNREAGSFFSSSGSTGTPIQVFFSKYFHQKWSAAYEVRVRNWAGVNHKMRRGMIGGRRIIPNAIASPPYYRYNYFEQQTYFSAYHLSAKTVVNYMQGLKKNNVEYLVGYAMSIYFWADFINNDANINPIRLKAVLTSSEKLTDKMREIIERAFLCKVYDAYSGVEACGLISENKYGELLFSPDTGILEVIDNDGNQVLNGESGEVISTGLLNYDQPLIRYRIGDRVTLAASQRSKHNSGFPIIKEIEGRIEDVVIGVDGRKMVRFHSIFININGLKSAQVIQHKLDFLEINLVVNNSYSKESEKVIFKRLESQLGKIKVKYSYLNSLPLTKGGKIKAVVSKLKK